MVVHFAPALEFAKSVGAQFVALSYDGHMGVGAAGEPKLFRRIEKFFRTK